MDPILQHIIFAVIAFGVVAAMTVAMSRTLAHCRRNQPGLERKLTVSLALPPIVALLAYGTLVLAKLTSNGPSDAGTAIAAIGILSIGSLSFLLAISNYWAEWKKRQQPAPND